MNVRPFQNEAHKGPHETRRMKFKEILSWDAAPGEAVSIQEKLIRKIKLAALRRAPRTMAGADVGFRGGAAIGGGSHLKRARS